jgi:hypothetical protein
MYQVQNYISQKGGFVSDEVRPYRIVQESEELSVLSSRYNVIDYVDVEYMGGGSRGDDRIG